MTAARQRRLRSLEAAVLAALREIDKFTLKEEAHG